MFDIDLLINLLILNTGVGKSTLTSLLTDAKLQSIEYPAGLGQFLITDANGLISDLNSPVTSKTTFPNLMIDHANKITYYDCAGFNDSRGYVNEISVTYSIHHIIQYARGLKFVFVMTPMASRHDFLDLATHAVTFIKNIQDYCDGIALIVTKVTNEYPKGEFIQDNIMIRRIFMKLEDVKSDLLKKNEGNIPIDEKQVNQKILQFLEILLQKNDQNECNRIGILRLPEESGLVENISKLNEEKRAIQSIIKHSIQFVSAENTNFGYTISDTSKNRIFRNLEPMRNSLTTDLMNIAKELNESYLQLEKYTTDLHMLEEMLSHGHEMFSKILSHDSKKCVHQMIDTANELGIGISENSHQIRQNIEFFYFLNYVSGNNVSSLFNISIGLDKTIQYLKESKTWYRFLIDLHNESSKYRVQDNDVTAKTKFGKWSMIRNCSGCLIR